MKTIYLFLAALTALTPMAGQSGGGISATDALTPKGLEPGSPAGSYALSGLDTVNLYNGHLNFSVPLLQVGSRGESGYTMRAQPGVGWEAFGEAPVINDTPYPTWFFAKNGPSDSYRAATIEVRYVGQDLGSAIVLNNQGQDACPGTFYGITLARITITFADGTQMELRDSAAGGEIRGPTQPLSCTALQQGAFNRGKIWVSADGSGAKFVADNDVYDQNSPSSASLDNPANSANCTPISKCITYHPSGTLYFKGGRKYHFLNYPQQYNGSTLTANDVDWIEDRNGNRTIFLYPSSLNPNPGSGCSLDSSAQSNFCVIDPLGRLIKVSTGRSWTASDPTCISPAGPGSCSGPQQNLYDQIDFPGAGGTNRTIQVYLRQYWFDRVASLSGAAWPTPEDLFSGPSCGSAGCPGRQPPPAGTCNCIGGLQISKIVLPDTSTYQFQYDQYGDLARVVLPTGGAYEFDWGNYRLLGGSTMQTCPVPSPLPESCAPIIHAYPGNAQDLLIAVYRRVVERREYANGGTAANWTRKTDYTVNEIPHSTSLGDPDGTCNATPDYGALSYGYATQGWCSTVSVAETDPAQGVLATQVHYFYGAASEGMFLVPGWYPFWEEGKEFRTDWKTPGGTVLHSQTDSWTQNSGLASTMNWWVPTGSGNQPTGLGPKPAVDPRVYQSDLAIDNGKISRRRFAADVFSNQTDLFEYAYGSGAPGGLVRQTHTDYVGSDNTVPASLPAGAPTPPAYTYLASLPQRQILKDGSGAVKAQTSYSYDEGTPSGESGIVNYNASVGSARGNATTVSRWRDTDGGGGAEKWLNTTTTFDVAGNPMQITQPGATITTPRITTYTYNYNSCAGCASLPNNYAFPDTVTNAAGQVTHFSWDYGAGKPASVTDPAGFQTTVTYTDLLDRPIDVTRAVGTATQNQTHYTYCSTQLTGCASISGSAPRVSIQAAQDRDGFQDKGLVSEAITDGLGRAIEARSYTSAGSYISAQKTVDALGRVRNNYNPVYSPTAPIDATTYTYDALGRTMRVDYSDASFDTTDFTSGDTVTVTDAAGKVRQQTSDAQGRVVSVVDNATTNYCYDILDDLLLANQNGTVSCGTLAASGGQPRTFAYNSLRELISANNPEVGSAINYAYYDSGDLMTKTAPGVATSYNYDLLDRIKGKSYSDGTPSVLYAYDTVQKGCLDSVTSTNAASGTTYTTSFGSYDPHCRVTASAQQIIGNPAYPFAYRYNLAGALLDETYPSGRVVATHFDGAGRPSAVCSVPGTAGQPSSVDCYSAPGVTPSFYAGCANSGDPACSVQYWPHGAIQSMKLGNGVTESASYNNRLQMLSMTAAKTTTLLGLSYAFPPGNSTQQTGNNGNLRSQTIHYDALGTETALTVVQNYPTYDSVNRLTGFTEGSINQIYDYDYYGNRWLDASSTGFTVNPVTPVNQSAYDASNNRLVGTSYDWRGNQSQINPFALGYDGEDRQKSAASAINGSARYEYDGNGHRVRKLTCGDPTPCTASAANLKTTVFVYDAFGQLAAEYSTAPASDGAEFYTADHLGSTRLVTDSSGNVKERFDYLPFGEGLGPNVNGRSAKYASYNGGAFPAGGDGESIKFTGKERDAESSLDYFGARYMSSAQGRFTSVDPIWITKERLLDPQRLNLYAYGRNNPLRYIDPQGMDVVLGACSIGTQQDCFDRVQQGLREEDRAHVHLVQGYGTNGFKEGQYGVAVDTDYKSDSKNFQTLQSLANDHSATASIDVLKNDDNFNVRVALSVDLRTGTEQLGTTATTPGEAGGYTGYTFYPYGKGVPGPFSTGNFTDVVVNADRGWIPLTIQHELRHVLLGDFGRAAPYGAHGTGIVDKETTEAEKEAVQNQLQVIRNQR
jgi:RHS repeat-associated protein